MLYIYTSNRLERLADKLVEVIQQQRTITSNLFAKEFIVVQNRDMQHWLSMQLAEKLGIWAGTDENFPFPKKMLGKIFFEYSRHEGKVDTRKFDKEVIAWSLMDILPHFLNQPEFTSLHHYLHDDENSIKRFQLATRIAATFDIYLAYRPWWITDYWEKGTQPPELEYNTTACWQAILWRELVQRYGVQHTHYARLWREFSQYFKRLLDKSRLPASFYIFGIVTLPPAYLDIYAKCSQLTDVHLFLPNPCKEYWADIVSDQEMARKSIWVKGKLKIAEELHFEKGNSLLASLGQLARDFVGMLYDYEPQVNTTMEEDNTFSQINTAFGNEAVSEETDLLHCIQLDILRLHERGEDIPCKSIHPTDHSIQIHSCHSPMREVEVLHDQLLALLAKHPKLLPKDIIVMMPNVEAYAPFIQAVFATTPDIAKRIPFSISDCSLRNDSMIVDTFLTILELSNSRLAATDLLAILETEAVQRRFDLVETDLPLIRQWIHQTGIRWGMDADSRRRSGLPAFEENTWRAGLKRLLLGYALSRSALTGTESLFAGILPYDEIEGSDTVILGKLVAFVETLFDYIHQLTQLRSLVQWRNFLFSVLDRFIATDEQSHAQVQHIRQIINNLVDDGQTAELKGLISHAVILSYLRQRFSYQEIETQTTPNHLVSSHYLMGHLTFCTLQPMRSIPFKVVYLLGMSDQSYPRSNKPLSFDLVGQHPRAGDRSPRHNDRYLFLEALLSAREYFYISYVGQSLHDDPEKLLPPSVLVNELLDYIAKGFIHPEQEITKYLIIHHPLQAFSPRYFNRSDERLFSYSAEYAKASHALVKERHEAQLFITKPLPPPSAEWKTVTIEQLVKFFTNPIKFLLKQRLGIHLHSKQDILEEAEPFEVKGLEGYQFNQLLVEKALTGHDLQEYQNIAKASGRLPHGQVGDYLYNKLRKKIQKFVGKVQEKTRKTKLPAQPVHFTHNDMSIIGNLDGLWSDNLVHYRCAEIKAKDHVKMWIHHLLLNTLTDLPRCSVLIGEDKIYKYNQVTESCTILAELLNWYWQGLQKPLYFFPESSLKFATLINKENQKRAEALVKALELWQGNSDFKKGEMEDDYYLLCFGRSEDLIPLKDELFKQLAEQFFKPLLNHQVPLK